jgi:hypothetical protein
MVLMPLCSLFVDVRHHRDDASGEGFQQSLGRCHLPGHHLHTPVHFRGVAANGHQSFAGLPGCDSQGIPRRSGLHNGGLQALGQAAQVGTGPVAAVDEFSELIPTHGGQRCSLQAALSQIPGEIPHRRQPVVHASGQKEVIHNDKHEGEYNCRYNGGIQPGYITRTVDS